MTPLNAQNESALADGSAYVGPNVLLLFPEYHNDYAAMLMADANQELGQLAHNKNEAAFCKRQRRAVPKKDARQRTAEDLMFGAALAEYEELHCEFGIEDAEYMATTFLECIADPCGVRDNFLSRTSAQLGYSAEKTRRAYEKAAKRVAAAQVEWAVPFKGQATKLKDNRPAIYRAIDKAISEMPREIGDLDLNTMCNRIVKHSQFDAGSKEYLIEQIAANTHRGKRAARKAVNESATAMRKKNKSTTSKDSIPVVNKWGEPMMAKWGEGQMASKAVDGVPAVFGFEGDVCHERNGKREMLSERQFAAIINDNTEWEKSEGDEKREVFAPDKVVGHMFHRQPKPYPELANVATAPYVAPDGRLVIEEGYDAETKTLLQLNGLEIRRVSATPSEDEVRDSLRLIFEEAFGDFPIGGMDRDGIVESLVDGEGEPNPDAAHLLAMLLQPFARDMIPGVTPMYAVTKPLPGTGGGLLLETASLITDGEAAAMLAMPPNEGN